MFEGPAGFWGATVQAGDFTQAAFHDDAHFEEVTFLESASFIDTSFAGNARFQQATFRGTADFFGSRFEHSPLFDEAVFEGPVRFYEGGVTKVAQSKNANVSFERRGHFIGARFEETADFRHAQFGMSALFENAHFERGVIFDGAQFGGLADFTACTFKAKPSDAMSFVLLEEGVAATFNHARFDEEARFERCSSGSGLAFNAATFRGQMSWYGARLGRLFFQASTFESPVAFAAHVRGTSDFRGATFRQSADFSRANFEDTAIFCEASFEGGATFAANVLGPSGQASSQAASFHNGVWFDWAVFEDSLNLADAACSGGEGASLSGPRGMYGGGALTCRGSRFNGPVTLPFAVHGRADLSEATFNDDVSFYLFTGDVDLMRCKFKRHSSFEKARFGGNLRLNAASFEGTVSFEKTIVEGNTNFVGASFHRARVVGPILVFGYLWLDHASFLNNVEIRASAAYVSATRAQFPEGATIHARWADIVLEETRFGGPSIVMPAPSFDGVDDERLGKTRVTVSGFQASKPRVVSLRRADVAELVLSDVDLRACRFAGAHNLDRLLIQGVSGFAESPLGLRWTRRQTLAEEHAWRSRTHGGAGWYPEGCRPPDALEGASDPPNPSEISELYRALRKGREDAKDEPGAADFYYGEMEMRRHDHTRSLSERVIVFLYWLVSGYGLRATRALTALLITVAAFAALLWWVGFEPRQEFPRALVYSAQSTSSLFRVPELEDASLTYLGEMLQIALRLLGPLFFGLTVLSLRGRVKR